MVFTRKLKWHHWFHIGDVQLLVNKGGWHREGLRTTRLLCLSLFAMMKEGLKNVKYNYEMCVYFSLYAILHKASIKYAGLIIFSAVQSMVQLHNYANTGPRSSRTIYRLCFYDIMVNIL